VATSSTPAGLRVAALAAILVLSGPQLSAGILDPRPLGEEVCMVADSGHPSERNHFLAGLGGEEGGFALAYGRPSSPYRLARVFDSEGLPAGPEIVVDEPFVGPQGGGVTDVVSDPGSGLWLATWHGAGSPGDDNSFTSVKARLFDEHGIPLGDSFQVNSTVLGVQSDAKATFLAQGGFAVVFEDDPVSFPSPFEIRARLFDGSGAPRGDDFLVAVGPDEGLFPEVVPTAGGGFVVVWLALDGVVGGALGLGVSEYLADGTLVRNALLALDELDSTAALTAEIDSHGNLRVATSVYVQKDTIIRVFRIEQDATGARLRETQATSSPRRRINSKHWPHKIPWWNFPGYLTPSPSV